MAAMTSAGCSPQPSISEVLVMRAPDAFAARSVDRLCSQFALRSLTTLCSLGTCQARQPSWSAFEQGTETP